MSDKKPVDIQEARRFPFGKNWEKFLFLLDKDRITTAEHSLKTMLRVSDLKGKSFLDIGSGSGLFSLAARRMGAQVTSFDDDLDSVNCTQELKNRYFTNDFHWNISRGSILDENFLTSLGHFDVVYSWGVLHHTGAMWQALENAALLVKPGGLIFISIYNDQGWASRMWRRVKLLYNVLPLPLKFIVLWPAFIRIWGFTFARDLVKGHPLSTWRNYSGARSMSPWRDVVDWVGGYPFEVAKPEQIISSYAEKGFKITRCITVGFGYGCNEFVFHKMSS